MQQEKPRPRSRKHPSLSVNEADGSMGLIKFSFDIGELRVLFGIELHDEPAPLFASRRSFGISKMK